MGDKIIVVQVGSVAEESLKKLSEKDIIVIQVNDVNNVRFLELESSPIIASDVAMSAIGTLQSLTNSNPSHDFLGRLYKRMLENEKNRKG